MRRLAVAVTVAAVALFAGPGGPTAAAPPAAPTLGLIATVPGATESALLLVPVGSRALPAPSVTFAHLPDAVVRARPLPGGRGFVAVADAFAARDRSWASALYLLVPGAPPTRLTDRVYHASHPLVTADGRIFVERGRAGPTREGAMRVDDLTVDEVDLAGRAHAVYSGTGYTAHLAAASDGELILYRVGPSGADVIALQPDTGRLRPLAAIEPFARDFSVDDSRRLVFADRAAGAWTVERLDLTTLARSVVWRGQSGHPAPHAWPHSRIALTPDDAGLALLPSSPIPIPISLRTTSTVDVVQTLSDDSAWAAALRYTSPDRPPQVIALRTVDQHEIALPAVDGVRLEIAGFVGARR